MSSGVIKGIGEKTALKLLEQYDTLENIINNVNELKGKIVTCEFENYNIFRKFIDVIDDEKNI